MEEVKPTKNFRFSSLPDTFVEGFHYEDRVHKMPYTEFGRTGLKLSKISLGGGTLSYHYGEIDEEKAIQAIQEAIKSGINYIDTAYWYGQGKSEEILGRALKNVPRQAYYIATKVARYERDFPNMFDFSAETAKMSLARSLKLLQLDYVDILQIHDIEFAPNMDIIWKKLLPALEEMRIKGLARFIGITGYSLKELKKCIEGAGSRIDMVLSYSRNTMIDDSLLEYLPFFKSNNLGLVCASVHGMGLLTNAGPQPWHPAHLEVKENCREAAAICKKSNIELGKLAMYYALQTDGLQTILVGMQTPELVNINLSAVFDGLSKEEINLYEKLKENIFLKILQRPRLKHWEGFEVRRYWSEIENEKRGK